MILTASPVAGVLPSDLCCQAFCCYDCLSAWQDLLFDTFTVVFVDNTAAQHALVSDGYLRTRIPLIPLAEGCMSTWNARGPSEQMSAPSGGFWLRRTKWGESGRILTLCGRRGNLVSGGLTRRWGQCACSPCW